MGAGAPTASKETKDITAKIAALHHKDDAFKRRSPMQKSPLQGSRKSRWYVWEAEEDQRRSPAIETKAEETQADQTEMHKNVNNLLRLYEDQSEVLGKTKQLCEYIRDIARIALASYGITRITMQSQCDIAANRVTEMMHSGMFDAKQTVQTVEQEST